MYILLWGYQVKTENQSEFEKTYSPNGAWADLFNKGTGYLGTKLIHSDEFPEQYVTLDRWASSEDYEAFLSQWKDEYEKLDAHCEGLTDHESCLGRFGARFS